MMLLKKMKNKKLFSFNNIILSSFLLLTIYGFIFNNNKVILNTNNIVDEYLLTLTYYYPGDATGSGGTTGAGISVSNFTVDENGWYRYYKDGVNYLVVAAATTYCRDAANHCGIDVAKHGIATNIPYYSYYDTLTLQIGEKTYDAIVLDSCGACMWGDRDDLGEKIDVFVQNSSAVKPGIYNSSVSGINTSTNGNVSINFSTNYTGDITKGYIYNSQAGKGIRESILTLADKVEERIDSIINEIFNSASYSNGKIGSSAYTANVTYLTGSFMGQIAYYSQLDYSNVNYGSFGTIASHGCAPTSMAIVISSFLGKTVNPVETTNWACNNGYCTSSGSSHALICAQAKQYGLNCSGEISSSSNLQSVVDALASGKSLVVVLAKAGYFTRAGHFFVLTGIDANGNVSVADPASSKNNNQTFTLDYLIDPARGHVVKFWIISR